MSRRFIGLGLLVAVAQLAAGCCWHRCCAWRLHGCGPVCAPSSSPSYSLPPSSAPIGSAPLFGGGPGCAGCATSVGYPGYPWVDRGVAVVPPPGTPMITSPVPIGPGPTIEPPQGLAMPMPVKPGK